MHSNRLLRTHFVRIISPLIKRTLSSYSSKMEVYKKIAAAKAVDDVIKDGLKIGIGSGSTIVFAVERLAEIVQSEDLNVFCVPTSFQAQQLILQHGLNLGSLSQYPKLDVVIDGADEVDQKLNLIKGGGGCQTQEKIVAAATDKLIIVADYTKESQSLGENYHIIPIEVIPYAHVPLALKISNYMGGKVELRMSKMKAGPVVTDNGNFILDWEFPGDVSNWSRANVHLTMMPGVVETGLFTEMADMAYFGLKDETVKIVNRTNCNRNLDEYLN